MVILLSKDTIINKINKLNLKVDVVSAAAFHIRILVVRFCDFLTSQQVQMFLTYHIICFDFLKTKAMKANNVIG